ncbi:MAG: ArsA family ATPase, partial [Halobacteria archaeon]|nr:ArsA family ATPase [Halobacteria archaeon]
GLWGVEVDPDKRITEYKGLIETLVEEVSEVGLRIDDEEIERIFEAGIVPGSDELAALDLFAEYVLEDGEDGGGSENGDDGRSQHEWDKIVFDTAPTGHTLRLLDLPDVMSTTMLTALSVRDKIRKTARSVKSMVYGPAAYLGGDDESDDLKQVKKRMERVSEVLCNPVMTEFRVVLLPETMSIRETERLVGHLEEHEVPIGTILVNKVLRERDIDADCRRCSRQKRKQEERIDEIRNRFDYEILEVPEQDSEVTGLESLERLAKFIEE